MGPVQPTSRRGFLAAVTVAALATLEGSSMPSAQAQPFRRLFRGIQLVDKENQVEGLARGVKNLTPEDGALASKLRVTALPIAQKLVEDESQKWESTTSRDDHLKRTTNSFLTKVPLSSGETLLVALSSQDWDQGPSERKLSFTVEGSGSSLTIRGGGPMEGVRANADERAQVDRLYAAISRKVGHR